MDGVEGRIVLFSLLDNQRDEYFKVIGGEGRCRNVVVVLCPQLQYLCLEGSDAREELHCLASEPG